jgi:hypothetical protein
MTQTRAGIPRQEIRFGAGGNDRPYLGDGWSGDEDGYRWMIGPVSELWLEHPGPAASYVLDVFVQPFVAAAMPRQALRIRVRGQEICRAEFGQGVAFGCLIPADLLAAPGPVRLTFDHPNAASPRAHGGGDDDRMLAFSATALRLTAIPGQATAQVAAGSHGIAAEAIEPRTGLPADRFMLGFESLGDNCEFGLVQRRCGAEPLSLLRFANIQLPALVAALDDRFARIGTPEGIRCELGGGGGRREFVVQDASYGITYHTFQYEGEVDQAELLGKQPTRQRFLARKLLEDLAAGEKIFVLRRNPPLALWQVLPVYAAIRGMGPNRLLWIDLASDGGVPGTVTEIVPGLYRGALDRLAPDANAHDLSLEVWLQVLLNTWLLTSGDHHSTTQASDT